MRRTILLVVAIALVVMFALLNWAELSRPTTLDFGIRTATAPLGWLLFGLLALTLLAYLVSSIGYQTRLLMETRQHTKALQAQRDLAEKAEASRLAELRGQLDTHLQETRRRETVVGTEYEKAMNAHQRELRTQLENMHRSLSTRLGEMEARLEGRLGRADMASPQPAATPAVWREVPRDETIVPPPVR